MRSFAICLALFVTVATSVAAQEVPANARKVSWGKGWECVRGYVERENRCVSLGVATEDEIRQYLIDESMHSYPGSCPCPYNVDRAGRRCGGRSAYSRPRGQSPLCYGEDIPDEVIKKARATYAPK
jgi:hypothetical protein